MARILEIVKDLSRTALGDAETHAEDAKGETSIRGAQVRPGPSWTSAAQRARTYRRQLLLSPIAFR
jgi:hypothetical protein